MSEQIRDALVILRRKQVEFRTGYSRSSLYERINPRSPRYDPDFPKPIKLGAKAVGWIEKEINAWLQHRIEVSRNGQC